MGFLKTKNYNSQIKIYCNIILLLILIVIAGCAASKIIYDVKVDNNPYVMYGEVSSCNFFVPEEFSDSLNKKWEADINGSFPNSSVSIYSNLVFVNDLSGRVYCFNIDNGKKVGQLKLGNGVYTTPVLNMFEVIAVSAERKDNESTLQYYNYKKAELEKEVTIEGRVISELIKIDDGIIFNTDKGIIYKYNFNAYQEWKCETNEFTHSSPALKDNIIVFGNDNGEIIGVDAIKGKLLYRIKISKPFFASPSIIDKTILIGNDDGNLYVLDLSTGKTNWSFETGGRIIMTPACDGSNIYIGNLKGDFFSINIKSHQLNWKIKYDGAFNTTPLVSENLILQPGIDRNLLFINKENGEIVKTMLFDGRVKLTPVYFRNILFIGYDNGILEAYEFQK